MNICRNGGLGNKKSSSSSGMKIHRMRAAIKVSVVRVYCVWRFFCSGQSRPEGGRKLESRLSWEFLTPDLADCSAVGAGVSRCFSLSYCHWWYFLSLWFRFVCFLAFVVYILPLSSHTPKMLLMDSSKQLFYELS